MVSDEYYFPTKQIANKKMLCEEFEEEVRKL
jgi:hypothetical protein